MPLYGTHSNILLFLRAILGRFSFNTPFTPGGKAHGDVKEQYMRKTILTSMESFPYVKKRSKVVKLDTVGLSTYTRIPGILWGITFGDLALQSF